VTDTASVKVPVVRAAAALFHDGRFIGGHPMAGTEFSGIRAANPLLFENAYWILSPVSLRPGKRQKALAQFYATLGARVVVLGAEEHDATMAMLSHVPQLAAVALTRSAGRLHSLSKRHVTLGAGGFRDLTRIASSPFGIWEQILDSNRTEVRKALRTLVRELQSYERALVHSSKPLASRFRDAARIREKIPRGMKGFLSPLVEFTAFVPDRPGMLARLTTALANEGVNLKDLELLKVREGRGGTFRIAVESERDRKCAERVVRRLFPEEQ
jgi:prephenate dehydrogenase